MPLSAERVWSSFEMRPGWTGTPRTALSRA